MKPKMGRPKGKVRLEKKKILEAALCLLNEDGSKGLSMRNLALRLKVTPMALYNHYEDRLAILRALSDMVYGQVMKDYNAFEGLPQEKVRFLLIRYYEAVIKHPNLSISIFETPQAFSVEVKKITDCLLTLILSSKIPKSKCLSWLNILIDFTHGSSIATAKNSTVKKDGDFVKIEMKRFSKELKILVDCIPL